VLAGPQQPSNECDHRTLEILRRERLVVGSGPSQAAVDLGMSKTYKPVHQRNR
jgi:hypothetical protein